MTMKLTSISARELDDGLQARWRELQRRNPDLGSPYFCPEFTLAVAAVRRDVRIVVMEEAGMPVGFFPFQRDWTGAGRAVGAPLSDAHGVIAEPGARWHAASLLRAAGLGTWEFDHLPASQAPFASFRTRLASSPALDLSPGFDAYLAAKREAGSRSLTELGRKRRKLERETGTIRFVEHEWNHRVLDQVFAWKSEQCRRSGTPDFFSWVWTRTLVSRLLETQTERFAGVLSALYSGEHLVAAHAGMRSDRVWHWWFPVYDHAFSAYSPGALLLLDVARSAAATGVEVLELGKGDDDYKRRFANLEIPLSEGCAARPSVAAAARDIKLRGEAMLRATRLADPLRPALRRVKRWIRLRRYA